MKRYIILIFLLATPFFNPVFSQQKDYYSDVDLFIWVVTNVEKVEAGWRSLGFNHFQDHGNLILQDFKVNGKVAKTEIKMVSANIGGAKVLWIQPISGESAFSQYLKMNGNGVFALMHEVPTLVELNSEVQRLNNLGTDVWQQGKFVLTGTSIQFVMMKTLNKGKYVLGLYHGESPLDEAKKSNNDLNCKFNQVAFALKKSNKKSTSAYWEKLGLLKFNFVYPVDTKDKKYYGEAADFDLEQGWQRNNVPYEWCIPMAPPTVYADHIKKYSEGFHHFGLGVGNFEKAVQYYENKGFKISMSGGWGEEGKPGSGKFAYVDTEEFGGESIELLWSYKE